MPEFIEKETNEGLAPFTLEDAIEPEKACMTCEHFTSCPIILAVNKFQKVRDLKNNQPVKTVEAEFSCCIYKEESDSEEIVQ